MFFTRTLRNWHRKFQHDQQLYRFNCFDWGELVPCPIQLESLRCLVIIISLHEVCPFDWWLSDYYLVKGGWKNNQPLGNLYNFLHPNSLILDWYSSISHLLDSFLSIFLRVWRKFQVIHIKGLICNEWKQFENSDYDTDLEILSLIVHLVLLETLLVDS